METKVRPTRAVAWPSPAIIKWQRELIAASGGDPAVVPDEPFVFLKLPEVQRRTGLARATIYRKMAEKTFPQHVPLGLPNLFNGGIAPQRGRKGSKRAA